MLHGTGVQGGVGKCHPFWRDFVRCMYECDTAEERATYCTAFRDDYLECINGMKKFIRQQEIRKVQRLKKRGAWDPSHYSPKLYYPEGIQAPTTGGDKESK
mmetsp:Transcript_4583/g.13854  ORF Transcript_4583/g.13854 Transcript_4583/m.13854 type:complete len:101 (-) Transcript_4583:51-353(-)|eukprot:CAMPEP_0198734862 /NCGR_PEP_ID=MMETSP1475-20131203/55637_1 /TAXON_ID= ORGANISM="Unidentified sp., Strain CCMP1999" /NCGR_SAMPLE_ID=MMETSP1475 /ASSEMBLY_ACC=CAM_ASM_001111 /LENGTH=100 /DNA_ID=CAMNT_0044498419 /DNA_START=119 /DNA_END=421 /DNA_ORIENTATION=-